MNDFDVTIIGAGLAGLHCAQSLARKRLRVLLVDRKTSLESRIHTTGIFVRKTLQDFDIPEDCLGPAIRRVSLYSPSLRKASFTSQHDEFRVGRMALLYNRCLDQCQRSGVTWLPLTSYLDHTWTNGSAAIRLSSKNIPFSVSSKFLIGSDGARSRVAEKLNLDVNTDWIVGIENIFRANNDQQTPQLHCFFNPEIAPGYIAWVADDGFEIHVGVGGYPHLFDPLTALTKFQTSVAALFDFSTAEHIERRGGRIPVGGVLRRICNEQGLLIGDAAGAVSPLTAGGLDPCLRLSSHAAEVTATYLQSKDPRVLQSYSGAAFRTRFTSRLWARRIAAQVRSKFAAELICAMLRAPVTKEIARHIFFGRNSFPDVEFIKGLPNLGTQMDSKTC
jgi:flavin-dependent dehydrogenase